MDKSNVIVCVYDDKGVSIQEKILEICEDYVKSSLQNTKNWLICTMWKKPYMNYDVYVVKKEVLEVL